MYDKWQALRTDIRGVLQIALGFLMLVVMAMIGMALASGVLWELIHLVKRWEHHT